MRRIQLLHFALLTFAWPSLTLFAQVPTSQSPVCNAQYAQLLVEQQVGESKSVTELDKRIKILIRSADFLWKLDELTARAFFEEAFKTANLRFKEIGFESRRSDGGLITILPDQRMTVIRAIAKRDAEWARRLMDQLLADYDKSDRGTENQTREVEETLLFAAQNAKSNPELSRYLFRRAMRYSLIHSWYFSLYTAAAADSQLTDTIYAEALRTYRNESPRRLLYLSAYPFGSARILGPDKFSLGANVPPNFNPNVSLQRQFLETVFARTSKLAATPEEMNQATQQGQLSESAYLVSALREIEPVILERFPDLLQRHSVAKALAHSTLNEEMRAELEKREGRSKAPRRTFEEWITALKTAESEGKLTDYMIVNFIGGFNLTTDDHFATAEPWLLKIMEEKPRRETINYFWFLRSKLAIKERRFDDGERFAGKVPEIEHRASLMFEMAEVQLKDENDAARVFDTLNSISKLTRSADNSVAKAQTLIGIANLYERVNHSLALDELSEAIRVINQLKDPDIFITTTTRQIVGKGFGFFTVFDTPGNNLETTFEEISKKDFELALANARSLDDKYFRTLAVIAVAGNCVKNAAKAPKPKK